MSGDRVVRVADDALFADADRQVAFFEGRWHTSCELARVANALDGLLNAAGAAASAPVALIVRNRPPSLAALIGMLRRKRPIIMIYSFQSADAIARAVRSREPAVIVAEDIDWTPELVGVAGELGCCCIRLDPEMGDPAAVSGRERISREARMRRLEPQVMLLTSGTTGLPKNFPISYDMMAHVMLDTSVLAAASPGDQPPTLLFYSMGNVSGLYNLIPSLAQRRPVVLVEKFTLETWLDFVRRFRPSYVVIPTIGFRMILNAGVAPEDLDCLKFIWAGGASLETDIHEAFEAKYGVPVLLAYGATEFLGVVSFLTLAERERWGRSKMASCGRPWSDNRMRIVDPDTAAEVPPGVIGALEVVAPAIGPQWERTADLALIDEDGFVYHHGRIDGAINRGGFKIVPAVVEQVLQLHPAVAVASVVGLADVRLGEVPAAAIELKPGASTPSPAELENHVRQHLPATHVPIGFKVMAKLPRNDNMKVSIPEIRKIVADLRS